MFYIFCYVALIIMCECKEDKCALSLIHPNGDSATYACDEECYFTYCDEKTKEGYIKTYPEEMKVCGYVNAT
jgi:hypothetical protein